MSEAFVPSCIRAIVPCHNAAAFVSAAVNSVMGQTYPDVKPIVVDDGSTDGSIDILRQLAAQYPSRRRRGCHASTQASRA